MLDVRRLRLLRELAHRGTIAAVAEALAYTPSAVSQQLSALEREAGTPLLAPDDAGVETVALFEEAMFLAAPRTFTPEPGEPHPLRRWRGAPWIVAPADTRCGTMTVRACEAAGFAPDVRHVIDDFPAVLA